jgi:hypothetical protein
MLFFKGQEGTKYLQRELIALFFYSQGNGNSRLGIERLFFEGPQRTEFRHWGKTTLHNYYYYYYYFTAIGCSPGGSRSYTETDKESL